MDVRQPCSPAPDGPAQDVTFRNDGDSPVKVFLRQHAVSGLDGLSAAQKAQLSPSYHADSATARLDSGHPARSSMTTASSRRCGDRSGYDVHSRCRRCRRLRPATSGRTARSRCRSTSSLNRWTLRRPAPSHQSESTGGPCARPFRLGTPMRVYLLIIGFLSLAAAHVCVSGAYFSDTGTGTVTAATGTWDKCHKHDHQHTHDKDCGTEKDDGDKKMAADQDAGKSPDRSSPPEPAGSDRAGADQPVPPVRGEDPEHDPDDSSRERNIGGPTPTPTPGPDHDVQDAGQGGDPPPPPSDTATGSW